MSLKGKSGSDVATQTTLTSHLPLLLRAVAGNKRLFSQQSRTPGSLFVFISPLKKYVHYLILPLDKKGGRVISGVPVFFFSSGNIHPHLLLESLTGLGHYGRRCLIIFIICLLTTVLEKRRVFKDTFPVL